MNTFIKSALIAVISIAAFSGCKKKESDPPVPIKKKSIHSSSRIGCIPSNGDWISGNYGVGGFLNSFTLGYFNDPVECRTPTPLIIAFHGGGFVLQGGDLTGMYPSKVGLYLSTDKSIFTPILPPEDLISNRIAYVTANYRVINEGANINVSTSLDDCKKFVKYMKDNAALYNIDTTKIILLGSSAGASAALWVGLQDPSIKGIIAHSPQATLDISAWRNQVFAPFGQQAYFDAHIAGVLDTSNINCHCNYLKSLYGTDQPAGIRTFSDDNHLNLTNLIDAGDPEMFIMTDYHMNESIKLIHEVAHVYTLKAKANSVGLKCLVYTPFYVYNPKPETVIQFCKRKFGL